MSRQCRETDRWGNEMSLIPATHVTTARKSNEEKKQLVMMMADEFGEFGCEGRARRNPLRVGPSWVDSSLHCWCDQWEDHEEDLILFYRLLGESRPGWLQLSFFFCAPRQCQTKIVYIADQNCDFYLKKKRNLKALLCVCKLPQNLVRFINYITFFFFFI